MTVPDPFQDGLRQHRAGDLQGAATLYRKALEANPGHFDACNNLGVVFASCGETEPALACWREAIKMRPDSVDARINLTAALHAAGQIDAAAEALAEAIRLAPAEGPLHMNLGLLRRQQKRPQDALDCFRTALAQNPTDLESRLNLAALLREAGEVEAAAEHYRELLRQEPTHAGACNDFGVLLQEMGQTEQARSCFEQAVRHRPDAAELRCNLGGALGALERFDEALDQFDEALRIRPDFDEARLLRANTLKVRGDFSAALAGYDAVLAEAPDNLAAQIDRTIALNWMGDIAGAHAGFDAALARDAASPLARYNRALLLLSQGRFAEAWPDFELRWQLDDELPRELPLPLWDGQPLDGRSILVLGEQGLGDMLMFARWLPALAGAAGTVTLTAEPRLVPLLARSFPEISVRPADYRATPEAPEGAALYVAIASLPRFVPPGPEPVAAASSRTLTPDEAAATGWRARYAALGPGLKVGVSWRGGASALDRRRRSIAPPDWAPLAALSGVHFVNLQHGVDAAETDAVEAALGSPLARWPDADGGTDFDDFVARVDGLDLVVSATNTTVHVAGALNRPAWCLTPPVPGWCFGLEGAACPWYPSVRLSRRAPDEPWAAVLARTAQALAERAAA